MGSDQHYGCKRNSQLAPQRAARRTGKARLEDHGWGWRWRTRPCCSLAI